jgi:hypothetical protein
MTGFKSVFLRLYLVGMLSLFVATLEAQPGDPGGDPDVPISGVEWLIGAGGIYGIRKLMKKNKQSDN